MNVGDKRDLDVQPKEINVHFAVKIHPSTWIIQKKELTLDFGVTMSVEKT